MTVSEITSAFNPHPWLSLAGFVGAVTGATKTRQRAPSERSRGTSFGMVVARTPCVMLTAGARSSSAEEGHAAKGRRLEGRGRHRRTPQLFFILHRSVACVVCGVFVSVRPPRAPLSKKHTSYVHTWAMTYVGMLSVEVTHLTRLS